MCVLQITCPNGKCSFLTFRFDYSNQWTFRYRWVNIYKEVNLRYALTLSINIFVCYELQTWRRCETLRMCHRINTYVHSVSLRKNFHKNWTKGNSIKQQKARYWDLFCIFCCYFPQPSLFITWVKNTRPLRYIWYPVMCIFTPFLLLFC